MHVNIEKRILKRLLINCFIRLTIEVENVENL